MQVYMYSTYNMPSPSTNTKGSPDGGWATQNIWQTISQMSRQELSEFWEKVNLYVQYESFLPVQHHRPHHSQLPKIETGLRDFSIGKRDYDDDEEMFSEKHYVGSESRAEIKLEGNSDMPDAQENMGWAVGAPVNQARAPIGDLNRLRAEYERTTRELRAAQEEYEDIAAERENAIREFKAAELVKNQLLRRRVEIEQRMIGLRA